MFKLNDKDKAGKEKVLEEIMSMMDGHAGSKLAGLKKPSVMEMSVSKLAPKDGEDMPEVPGLEDAAGDDDGDEPSDDEKAQIASLYAKYCK